MYSSQKLFSLLDLVLGLKMGYYTVYDLPLNVLRNSWLTVLFGPSSHLKTNHKFKKVDN